ncbi:MAG: transposase [Nitriliruptoraceae bacterium]
MAYHYIGGMRDQSFLLPVSMADWLVEGHLAWFVIDVVERVDTTALHALHPNDGPGRPAYDPDMMLTMLLYAYMMGQRSSRRIEAACRTDAAYRVICGDVVPDHATIARFLIDHEQAIEGVFVEVLRLCAAAGLVTVGTVAVDGTKIGSDAALDQNRSAEWIRREVEQILSEARQTDQDEDGQPSLYAADELPARLSSATGRLARLEEAAAVIKAQDAAEAAETEARAAKARAEAAAGRKLRGRKPKDPHAALARAEADETATRVKAQAKASTAHTSEADVDAAVEADPDVKAAVAATATARTAAQQAGVAKTRANVTDPQSRIMSTATGWVQGYNAQAMVNDQQIIIACHVSQDAGDVGLYQPMVEATLETLDQAGITQPIGLVLADAGYWSQDNATCEGPDRLIATTKDWKQRAAARELGTTQGEPPAGATPLEAMEHRLRTEAGAAAYAKRSHTVEPVFASKSNHDYRRFRRRGLEAATSEWALMATAHNLGKLHRAC